MTMHLHYDDLRQDRLLPAAQRAKNQHRLGECLKERVKLLENDQLLEDYSELLAGDDWEGGFTSGGCIAMQVLTEELESRLKAIGFLADG